jgi:hypothetical protein
MEAIEIDIPQIIVKALNSGSSFLKEFIIEDQFYLRSYLRQKYYQYHTQHAILNEMIRRTYLLHDEHLIKRQTNEYYDLDNDHFEELHLIEIVSQELFKITKDILWNIHFMNHLRITNQFENSDKFEAKISALFNDPDLSKYLHPFETYYKQLFQINTSINTLFIQPAEDKFQSESEPCVFICSQREFIFTNRQSVSLRTLIEGYNNFFDVASDTIRKYSPDGISKMMVE